MGVVILLHIFGKVTSIKGSKSAEAAPEDVGPDNSTQDLWEYFPHKDNKYMF